MASLRETQRSVAELRRGASQALTTYTDPRGHYAFNTYDSLGDPDLPLSPADVLMVNLLSLRLTWREVIPMFSTNPADKSAHVLRLALDDALVRLRHAPPFEDHETLEALENTLAPVARANEAARELPQWTYVTVSKVLHRRLPHIVPIIDSRVRDFYGINKQDPRSVRASLWHDLRRNRSWLAEKATRHRKPDGRPMSVLRCADIVIWSADLS